MMKKRIISMILTLCMVGCCLPGCSKETTADKVQTKQKQNVKTPIDETDIDFIKDGVCDYVVVCPEKPTENESFAADELQYFIQGACGDKVSIVKESAKLEDGKHIYVGATEAAEKAGVIPTYEEVKHNGFVIKQKDDDVYIVGYSDIGTRNGIYEFLSYAFDYEFYAVDEIRLTETKNAKMLAYDLMETPSFDWRDGNNGEIIYNSTISHRMRFNETKEILVTDHLTHNSMTIIDPTVYDWKSKKYKDWYSETLWTGIAGSADTSERPAQLCYSNDEMRKEFTKNLIELIKESKATNMLLGMEDNVEWCTCDKCTASKEKYGTDSAVIIKFVNKVQADVDKWFEENRPGEETVHLVFFAYYSTVNPPATFNSDTQTWEAMDDEVILNDHSGVMFAPIKAKYSVPFESSEVGDVSSPHGQIKGWSALSKNLYAWTYSLLPISGLVFFDTLEVMQQNYQLLAENGTVMLLDQTDAYQKNINTGFARLKGYVMSKLQWDTSLNMQELIDDFFDNYFAESADTMQNLFQQEREWMTHIYADLGAEGYISDNLVDSTYWSYNQLQGYMDLIDQAYQDIEPLREINPERYATLYDRILVESMQFRYLMISIYYTEFSEAEILEMRKEFKYDFNRLGLTSYRENVDIAELWNEWGID